MKPIKLYTDAELQQNRAVLVGMYSAADKLQDKFRKGSRAKLLAADAASEYFQEVMKIDNEIRARQAFTDNK